jgi:hypothetical protein
MEDFGKEGQDLMSQWDLKNWEGGRHRFCEEKPHWARVIFVRQSGSQGCDSEELRLRSQIWVQICL